MPVVHKKVVISQAITTSAITKSFFTLLELF